MVDLKSVGEEIGELFGVIGSASVSIRKHSPLDKSVFAWVRRVFVTVRGWSQNPSIYDHAGSSPAPGTPSTATTYSTELSRLPRFNPATTGKNAGNSLEIPSVYERTPDHLLFHVRGFI